MWGSRLALARLYRRVRRQGGRMRGLFGYGAENTASTADECHHIEARARFWAEFREGQREADAQSARPEP